MHIHACYKVFINSAEFSIGAEKREPIDEDNVNLINHTSIIFLVIAISQDEYDILVIKGTAQHMLKACTVISRKRSVLLYFSFQQFFVFLPIILNISLEVAIFT